MKKILRYVQNFLTDLNPTKRLELWFSSLLSWQWVIYQECYFLYMKLFTSYLIISKNNLGKMKCSLNNQNIDNCNKNYVLLYWNCDSKRLFVYSHHSNFSIETSYLFKYIISNCYTHSSGKKEVCVRERLLQNLPYFICKNTHVVFWFRAFLSFSLWMTSSMSTFIK